MSRIRATVSGTKPLESDCHGDVVFLRIKSPVPLLRYLSSACCWGSTVVETKNGSQIDTVNRSALCGSLQQGSSFGEYYFMNIPEVSSFQWHPISVSGVSSANSELSFHIKNLGKDTWTAKVAEKVAASEPLSVALDGPYGQMSLNLMNYRSITIFVGRKYFLLFRRYFLIIRHLSHLNFSW